MEAPLIAPAAASQTVRRSALSTAAREALLLVTASVFLALTARISLPLPFTPVPLTGQTLGVLLVGALYGPRRGPAAVIAYLVEGAAGLPVFAGGASGLAVLLGPTAGYLYGFVPAAWLAGWLSTAERRVWRRLMGVVLATMAIYVAGAGWLVAQGMPAGVALALGVLPFLPGDAIKAALAGGVVPAGARLLDRLGVRPY